MSRLLNAEYACSIRVLVSAIQRPATLAEHSVFVIPPVCIIADEPRYRKGEAEPCSIFLPVDAVRREVTGKPEIIADSLFLQKPSGIGSKDGLTRDTHR